MSPLVVAAAADPTGVVKYQCLPKVLEVEETEISTSSTLTAVESYVEESIAEENEDREVTAALEGTSPTTGGDEEFASTDNEVNNLGSHPDFSATGGW